ncbi:hypothetical protein KOR42_05950 [Thalassoglobus neptunius]|uniref:Uncharacterized protein n=1 Tax=Thalassoglobus neptunius TaxID=1938619 RepID=A0A5C5X2I2_9PLAN|nr:hypothetical protein [Thalassoglobus neptunius]TWT57237.1 hypothetical protein KOR42_05950 [Thalassoglobus neptunius]
MNNPVAYLSAVEELDEWLESPIAGRYGSPTPQTIAIELRGLYRAIIDAGGNAPSLFKLRRQLGRKAELVGISVTQVFFLIRLAFEIWKFLRAYKRGRKK